MTKTDRKKQIIEQAARLFASKRFDEVLMDDIAQQAGVGKGTLIRRTDGLLTESALFDAATPILPGFAARRSAF